MKNMEIIDYTREGLGIAKNNEHIYFIYNALIGEKVDIKVISTKKNISIANVEKYHTTSINRVEPICKYFLKCGGCDLLHMNYEEQLLVKKKGLNNLLKKNKLAENKLEIFGCKNNLGYRNKVTFSFFVYQGELKLGLKKSKSHDIINITYCHLVSKEVNDIKDLVVEKLSEVKFNKNRLEQLIIRENKEGNILLIFKVKGDISHYSFLKDLNINDKVISISVFNGKDIKTYKEEFLKEEIGDTKYLVSPLAFFQINNEQTKNLYEDIKDLVSDGSRVLDAYCGIGSIGLYVREKASYIRGIEVNEQAILNAKQNAKQNNFENFNYYQGDIKRIIKDIYNKDMFDVVIVDPPRNGIDKNFINVIKEIKPKEIIYMSCNISTLVRDIKELVEYKVTYLKGYDMFCQTHHLEVLVKLEQK